MQILSDIGISPRQFKSDIKSLNPEGLFIGQGNQAIEIISFNSKIEPSQGTLHQAYKERRGSRASPLLVLVSHPNGISLCGVTGDKPPIFLSADKGQIQRLCLTALKKPNRNIAINFLANNLLSLEEELPGIVNQGLLSTHELLNGVKNRTDWNLAAAKSTSLSGKINEDLLTSLGYTSIKLDNLTKVLKSDNKKTALAVLLKEDELPEMSSSRFNNLSPVSYALSKADQENIPWVIFQQDEIIRLYSAENIGVSKRGRSETYIECNTILLSEEFIGLLWLLFSADALNKNGTIDQIIEQSNRFAIGIAEDLRERIYNKVVPLLAKGMIEARNLNNPSKKDLSITYEMVILVIFRLLFISYAEDRDLLPYKTNENYRKRSLKQKAIELSKNDISTISNGHHHWEETAQLFNSIYFGNEEWGMPAYEGSIFAKDPEISLAGHEISKIKIENKYFELALKELLLDQSNELIDAPVDFRSLSVREFGTIYEGLLESNLSFSRQDLSIDKKGFYFPSGKNDEVIVKKNDIYLHDNSGARKSSGSYFTKDFVVEYLLDKSLEPALKMHLDKISSLSEADRAEELFNFRVADIAMGSGHFLVAAIDRIERQISFWLNKHPTPSINNQLNKLRESAKRTLDQQSAIVNIEDNQILRRMIAKRCIYGIDLNTTAVQLAQLSVWIHTFVPGLPLSLLEHNMIKGNSLIGLGSIDEIKEKFDETKSTLFAVDANDLLEKAARPLLKLAKLSDENIEDIEKGRQLINQAKQNTLEVKSLCDLITAQKVSNNPKILQFPFEDWDRLKSNIGDNKILKEASNDIESLYPVHFPIAFPEVFLSKSKGFNVIVGNPPWEEAVANEDKFWGRHFSGFSGLKPREQEERKLKLREERPDLVTEYENEKSEADKVRNYLNAGNFPGMGVGDPDLYKAFLWRFWNCSSFKDNFIGIVLPRTAMTSKGSENFRKELINRCNNMDLMFLQNNKKWVFDIHERYTISLCIFSRNNEDFENKLTIKGPLTSFEEFISKKDKKTTQFNAKDVLKWNESASLPLLPTDDSVDVFKTLMRSPWLSHSEAKDWRARPDRELDATSQKSLMNFSKECPSGFWKVYKGASFDIWEPDTGEYNAFADPNEVLPWLQNKRVRANSSARDSVHKEFSKEYILDENTLAPLRARIAFRDITNRTNTRTVIPCLIPPNTFVTNKGPTIVFSHGNERDEAYLLGILSSIPLDWFARRFVETNVNFFILNSFPIPRPKRSDILFKRVVELSGRLASSSDKFKDWAKLVEVECGPLDEDIKADKIYELDAVVSLLYGLKENDIIHIFETFHEGWNYEERLKSVLSYYNKWRSSV